MTETPVEQTDFIKEKLRVALGDLVKITLDYSVVREKGYYGICFGSPSKSVRQALSIDREILILITTFEDQQTRAIQTAREIIAESEGRLDTSALIIVHKDSRGNAKLKKWGRELSLAVMPLYYNGTLPSGEALLRNLSHELFSYDAFDITGPVADDIHFYGRREEARDLAKKLQLGQIRAVFGIRKIGKTSILHRVIKEVTQNYDCTVLLVDAQSDSIFEMNASQLLASIASSLQDVSKTVSVTPYRKIIELSEAVEMLRLSVEKHERQILIVFDEIDYLTPTSPTSIQWRSEFNRFWRNMRAVYQSSAAGNRNLSLLISGVSSKWFSEESIDGIENAALSFVPEEYLTPLPRGASSAMIRRLGKIVGLTFTDAVAGQIAEACADMPFWIRKACSFIHGKVDIGLRPFELQATLASDYLKEFVATDGTAMSEVALTHLFRVYPELKDAAIYCATSKAASVDPKTIRTLEKYGIIKSSRQPSISGLMMSSGISNFQISSTKAADEDDKIIPHPNYGDWADELAIISRRRNIVEKKLRSITANFIRFSTINAKVSDSLDTRERVLKCVDAKRRLDLQKMDLDDLFSKLYWLELIAIMKKEWPLFERIFGDRRELDKFADIVNERPDAHAKEIDQFDIAYHRSAISWFENRLEHLHLTSARIRRVRSSLRTLVAQTAGSPP